MGRGDKRTAKGKRTKGSFGNSRRHKAKKPITVAAPKKAAEVAVEAPAKKPKKKKAE